jgi:hypothetical protein
MTIALANGAKEIIPTENIATAVRVAKVQRIPCCAVNATAKL